MALTINTNLSSMLVQMNLAQSTFDLNKAIERMTTGYKLNHASDNAANYSIAQNMVSWLSSYDIASENISMGTDLVQTASDSIALMQQHAERIHNLVTQAMNGTYGEDSQKAISSEINARIAEIDRLYQTTEYNGISLFNNQKIDISEGAIQPGESGFIDENALSGPVMVKETGFIRALSSGTVDGIKDSYTDAEIAAMTKVKNLTKFSSGQTYAITDVEDLQKLAELHNAGKSIANVTFVLGADLDLSGVDWTPIGDNTTTSNATRFRGTFNGNGHTISNLTVNNPDAKCQGLFGYVNGGKIRNLGLENAEISGDICCGALAGYTSSAKIDNCFAESTVSGKSYIGGLIGRASNTSSIKNSYSSSSVSGQGSNVGGLVGHCNSSSVENSYSSSTVSGLGADVGGLVGQCVSSSVENSYSFSTVSGLAANVGGLVGLISSCSVSNSYSNANVNSASIHVGVFAGGSIGDTTIDTCYSSGSVSGNSLVGGFIGTAGAGDTTAGTTTIANSSSYCTNIFGGQYVGSFIGGYRTQSYYPDDFISDHGDQFIYNGGLSLTNCESATLDDTDMIGGAFIKQFTDEGYTDPETGDWVSAKSHVYIKDESCDLTPLLAQIEGLDVASNPTDLQVGINGYDSSRISFDTNFVYNLSSITVGGKVNKNAYTIIDNFINKLSAKATSLGAVSNRLDSALESTTVAMQNLTSSLSTIRDADVAKEASAYIKAQILQQASATLLATANQSPSVALQLL